MRFSVNIPNFGDFADAETVAKVASATETAGWDALFVWDHVVHDKRYRRSFGDPWTPHRRRTRDDADQAWPDGHPCPAAAP